jgi:hypothetical protein
LRRIFTTTKSNRDESEFWKYWHRFTVEILRDGRLYQCVNMGGVKLTKFLKYTYKAIAAGIESAVAVVWAGFQSRRDDTLLTVGVAERILRQSASSIQSALSIRQNALSIWGNTLLEWGNALSTRGNALSERGDALFPWENDSS